MSLYGLSSRYAVLSIFLTWSGSLAYMVLSMICSASAPKTSSTVFWISSMNSWGFCVEVLNLSVSHSHCAFAIDK